MRAGRLLHGLATRCRKGWPDQDVGTSLRGADGSRPVFFVVATPFRSRKSRSGRATPLTHGPARRRRDIQSCLRGGYCLNPDPAKCHRAFRHHSSLTVGVAETIGEDRRLRKWRELLRWYLSSIEMTRSRPGEVPTLVTARANSDSERVGDGCGRTVRILTTRLSTGGSHLLASTCHGERARWVVRPKRSVLAARGSGALRSTYALSSMAKACEPS